MITLAPEFAIGSMDALDSGDRYINLATALIEAASSP